MTRGCRARPREIWYFLWKHTCLHICICGRQNIPTNTYFPLPSLPSRFVRGPTLRHNLRLNEISRDVVNLTPFSIRWDATLFHESLVGMWDEFESLRIARGTALRPRWRCPKAWSVWWKLQPENRSIKRYQEFAKVCKDTSHNDHNCYTLCMHSECCHVTYHPVSTTRMESVQWWQREDLWDAMGRFSPCLTMFHHFLNLRSSVDPPGA